MQTVGNRTEITQVMLLRSVLSSHRDSGSDQHKRHRSSNGFSRTLLDLLCGQRGKPALGRYRNALPGLNRDPFSVSEVGEVIDTSEIPL